MTPQAKMFLAMLHEGAEGDGPRDVNGAPDGPWVFVAGGRTRGEGNLVAGTPHGTWRVWDAHGRLRSESEWDTGQPCGRWVTWDGDGQLERVDVKGPERPHAVLVALSHRSAASDPVPV